MKEAKIEEKLLRSQEFSRPVTAEEVGSGAVDRKKRSFEKEDNISVGQLDEMFESEEIKEYLSGGRSAEKTLATYRDGIEKEMKQRDRSDMSAERLVKEAFLMFFKKNKQKRDTKLGELLLAKVEEHQPVEKKRTKSEEEAEREMTKDKDKDKDKEKEILPSLDIPKSFKDFMGRGFMISGEHEKYYYNNRKTGDDLEISGFDPESGKVLIVRHQHLMVDGEEDGQNVLVFGEETAEARTEQMSFAQFEELIGDYDLQVTQENVAPEVDENSVDEISEKQENNTKKGIEQNETVELDSDEERVVEEIFAPYAKTHFEADPRLNEASAEKLKRVQKDSNFWGTVLPSKMVESTFIRKEVVDSAVNHIKDKIEREMSGEAVAT